MKKNESQSFSRLYVVPLFWALILPLLIGIFNPLFLWNINEIISFLALGIPVVIILQTIIDFQIHDKSMLSSFFSKLSISPAGCIYKSDLDIPNIPFVAISLVIVNILIFFIIPASLFDKYTFFPYGETTWFQIILSFFLSAFLHVDLSHLIGNMIFLQIFASVLESRLGIKRFLAAYFFFIIASKALTFLLLAIKIHISGVGALTDYHSCGASGAISGLMGCFVVRCYFARLTFSFPFIGWIGFGIKVPGVILIGMYFFAFDVIGSVEMFQEEVFIGYWSHVGGYLGGIFLGYLLKLNKEGEQEALRVKAKQLNKNPLNRLITKETYEEILNNEPENELALLNMLHSSRWRKEEAGLYFSRLMGVYLNSDFPKAVVFFTAHYQDYASFVSDSVLFRMGSYFYKQHKLKEASWCLEIVAEREGVLKIKAILVLGKVYNAIGNPEMAKKMFRRVLSESSEPSFHNEAKSCIGSERSVSKVD